MVSRHSLVAALRGSPGPFREIIASLTQEGLRWSDGGWSIAAVVTHLAMNEVFTRERLHHIASEDNPVLIVFRTDQAIPVGGNPILKPNEIFAQWQTLRESLCDWLEMLPEPTWTRQARHPERGETSFLAEVEIHLEHDQDHLAQVNILHRAWQSLQVGRP